MTKLNIQLVTPERTVLSSEITSLSCPTTNGQITILPGHASLVSSLESGELIAKNNTETNYIHVAGGFIEVRPNNQVVILADAAEHAAEIDLERAELAKAQAERLLKEQTLASEEYATTAWLLRKNLNRIKIAKRHSRRNTRGYTSDTQN